MPELVTTQNRIFQEFIVSHCASLYKSTCIVKSDGVNYSLTIGQTLFLCGALTVKVIVPLHENSGLTTQALPM